MGQKYDLVWNCFEALLRLLHASPIAIANLWLEIERNFRHGHGQFSLPSQSIHRTVLPTQTSRHKKVRSEDKSSLRRQRFGPKTKVRFSITGQGRTRAHKRFTTRAQHRRSRETKTRPTKEYEQDTLVECCVFCVGTQRAETQPRKYTKP